MPQPTSSIQTGALTLSAASLVPIIDWAASRLNITIPVDAQLQIAALLITVGHAVYNLLLERRIGIAQARRPTWPAPHCRWTTQWRPLWQERPRQRRRRHRWQDR
ncbi:hypothetical protein [Burkholderia glumae]|uniref:hypothetical protein n=1 Tax=Burkholderia glumae TaxID=337 RepID=UPI003B9D2EEC